MEELEGSLERNVGISFFPFPPGEHRLCPLCEGSQEKWPRVTGHVYLAPLVLCLPKDACLPTATHVITLLLPVKLLRLHFAYSSSCRVDTSQSSITQSAISSMLKDSVEYVFLVFVVCLFSGHGLKLWWSYPMESNVKD